jgi:hypothetical protein
MYYLLDQVTQSNVKSWSIGPETLLERSLSSWYFVCVDLRERRIIQLKGLQIVKVFIYQPMHNRVALKQF